MTISDYSINFMVDQEDGSEVYYDKTEEHWDWPGGASGPTAGVGYDCGYVTATECRADWTGIVSDAIVLRLIEGVGKRGDAAHIFVLHDRLGITVTWDEAIAEFKQRELPKWTTRCSLALPNFGELPPDCAGAITSLAYNRGTGGFHSTIPRFREMHQIYNLMIAKEFSRIPGQIRSMRRLWRVGSDLYERREAEAKLFERGLNIETIEV